MIKLKYFMWGIGVVLVSGFTAGTIIYGMMYYPKTLIVACGFILAYMLGLSFQLGEEDK